MRYLVNYTVKELIKETVVFMHYRKGSLYYVTAKTGFIFEVPIADTGDAEFSSEDRGVFFMRWIRRQLELNQQGREES